MSIAISLALLILSAVATLAAFGGKTWVEDERPLWQRITRRGWVALLCLTLATGFGVTKTVLDNNSARQAAKLRQEDRDKLTQQGVALRNARESLERQSLANLVMILSGTHRVVGQKVELKLPGMPGDSATIGEVLLPKLAGELRPLVEFEISFSMPGNSLFLRAGYNDPEGESVSVQDGQAASASAAGSGLALIYYAEDPGYAGVNAATGYSSWAKGPDIVSIGIKLVKRARSAAEIAAFDRAHPGLSGTLERSEGEFVKTYDPPAGLLEAVRADVKARFAKSVARLYLRQPQEELAAVSIAADVRCDKTWKFNREIHFACAPTGAPRIEVDEY